PGAPPEPAGGHRWPGRSPARSRRDDWPRPPRRPGPPRAGGARRPADGPRRRRRLGDGRPPGGGEALATGPDADADTRATTAAGHHDDGTDDAPHAVAATRTLTRASARDGRAPGRLPQRGAPRRARRRARRAPAGRPEQVGGGRHPPSDLEPP